LPEELLKHTSDVVHGSTNIGWVSRHTTYTHRPDRLVKDKERFATVETAQGELKLLGHVFIASASLFHRPWLTHTEHHFQVVTSSSQHFLMNEFIRLAEERAAFYMAEHHKLRAAGFEHVR
jgi:hypothetical protein